MGTRTVLLIALVALFVAEAQGQINAQWVLKNTTLSAPRQTHKAVKLLDGRVMVIGGYSDTPVEGTLATCEIYDPILDVWTQTGSLNYARIRFVTNLLPDGKVFVTGGAATSRAELYDPSTGVWTLSSSLMNLAREMTASVLLSDGRVMVIGGQPQGASGAPTDSVEVYDPTTDSWSQLARLNRPKRSHTATLLQDGTILVAGGIGLVGSSLITLNDAEVYSVPTNIWNYVGDMPFLGYGHTATLLWNGRVITAGGFNSADSETELVAMYDPASETWSALQDLSVDHGNHATVLLPNDIVLVIGGQWSSLSSNPGGLICEYFMRETSQSSGFWFATASLNVRRELHTATVLNDGTVLVVGGRSTVLGGGSLASVELYMYDPLPPPATTAPTTQSPTTRAPTTQAPTTIAPTTRAPTTKPPLSTQPPPTPFPTNQEDVSEKSAKTIKRLRISLLVSWTIFVVVVGLLVLYATRKMCFKPKPDISESSVLLKGA